MDTTLYCPRCGQSMTVATEDLSRKLECPHCRHVFQPDARSTTAETPPQAVPPHQFVPDETAGPGKNRLVAGLLGIFLGGLGVHRFYLGYPGIGILQILVSMMGCSCVVIGCFPVPVPLGWLWGFMEGILCLTGSMRDADGRPLDD